MAAKGGGACTAVSDMGRVKHVDLGALSSFCDKAATSSCVSRSLARTSVRNSFRATQERTCFVIIVAAAFVLGVDRHVPDARSYALSSTASGMERSGRNEGRRKEPGRSSVSSPASGRKIDFFRAGAHLCFRPFTLGRRLPSSTAPNPPSPPTTDARRIMEGRRTDWRRGAIPGCRNELR